MTNAEAWYVIKQSNGHCEIVPASSIDESQPEPDRATDKDSAEQWGPFDSQGEAIARRVGLIRAGKCQPV
ncbi:MAG: DDE transposase family protein [Cyanobacteria bacterium CRU_2_1]|nr:DDE transposase family protein [Cyanobacteria bacterium RU_5_0]NJR60149.1 DDE transposase family protein [Cyanobacteria bacterium CRU_2_1]